MVFNRMTATILALGIACAPATRVAANDLASGIVGGIIGGVIVNEANKNRQRQRTTSVPRTSTSSYARQERREIQTSLNYFGFPAGTPDGVLGRRSRSAIAQYQAHMGYPVTGHLAQYEKDFLITSYHRAIAGGAATHQLIAANPMGPKGLLISYRDELAGTGAVQTAPVTTQPATTNQTFMASANDELEGEDGGSALPNFLGGGTGQSLASHCNTVSLVTNTNGGFTTVASMSDPNVALNEQFCLARTYAIATGEDLASKVSGFTPQQIAAQCDGFGPALQQQVAALSVKPRDAVLGDVSGFVLSTGMSPAQLAGTAKICLSVGYRTDNMEVALGSALLLTALGERAYGELMGHHLAQGFGTSRRTDLALSWYEMGLEAVETSGAAVFAPGQPERTSLIRQAAYSVSGGAGVAPQVQQQVQPAALPTFSLD